MQKELLEKLQTLTILYAEDEEGIRKNIADSLQYYVKEVIEASNGEEAFELYNEKKPDIIFSDIHMPILNGIDFVKRIRKDDRKTPVVMITAHTDKNYKYDCDKKQLFYKDESIILNKKEMLFFEVLISNQNRITSYDELQDKVWQDDVMTDSALRSLVRNLRKKLPTDIIYNLSGSGYRFA